MKMLKKWLIMSVLFLGIIGVNAAHADETDLFATVPPDVFILLDLSGSMDWLAMETDNIDYLTVLFFIPSTATCASYTGAYYTSYQAGVATKPCAIDQSTIYIPSASTCTDYNGTQYRTSSTTGYTRKCSNASIGADTSVISWGDANCLGPYYRSTGSGHDVSCKKADIAKRALGDLLDDNNDGAITVADILSLKVRIGFGSYYNNTYSLRWDISKNGDAVNYPLGPEARYNYMAPYSRIFCNNATTCSPLPPYATTGETNVRSSRYTGGTPLGQSMGAIKTYLDNHRDGIDAAYITCRKKYVIVITDGSDTTSTIGGCSSPTALQRRRYIANQAKMLKDAGYETFVVGLGANMPAIFTNTLEWMAYLGGTDNPMVPNCVPTDACSTTVYNPNLSVCANDSTGNDPGNIKLTGRAFLASNASQLTAALKSALNMIMEGTYSFSAAPAVSAIRDSSENFLYEASFIPKNEEPFWPGNLKKYEINTDGSVGDLLWNAGTVLQSTAASARSIWTSKVSSGAVTAFTTVNISAADLNVATTALRDSVVGFYRGEPTYNIENWKLGDVFRSTPIVVGTPASYFYDPRQNGATSFAAFRTANPRTSDNGNRIVLVGANDGQLHAFKTSDGTEVWSFIPPNLMNKLASIVHNVHPTALGHQFFVDGQSQVADVWTGTGTGGSKVQSEWKTLAIFSLGRTGAGNNLWSSSASCYSTSTSAFSDTWSATNNQYCGYHALDITSTLSPPSYYWHIKNLTASQGPYLGVPMGNKMQIGRIKNGTSEKWVGFIGGGYESTECSGACSTSTNKKGKGFFVVDLTDGSILWSYTNANSSDMSFSISATPLAVDLDNDGFIDTVYVGDLGGNMWRFRFCAKYDSAGNPVPSSCTLSNTTASMLYQAGSTERPKYIFTQAASAKDSYGNVWVYFGTGNKLDPVSVTGTNRFFAVKENISSAEYYTGTHTTADLKDITSSTYCAAVGTGCTLAKVTTDVAKHGWYMDLPGPGEKIIADIKVFAENIYFTTYLPYTSASDACLAAGTSSLYGINYLTGVGTISGSAADTSRSINVGVGIASTPVISLRPDGSGADLFITTSGGGGIGASTGKKKNPPMPATSSNILYWRDRRVQ